MSGHRGASSDGPAEVAVIIPTRDRPAELERCVRAVLDQRGVAVEVVVVDDGSATPAPRASDSRVRTLRHFESRGPAEARNAGAAATSAPWLAFCDDDDVWLPGKLRSQLDAARGASWVVCGARRIDQRGDVLDLDTPDSGAVTHAALVERNRVPGGCSGPLITRSLFDAVGGFDPSLRIFADWELWMRLAEAAPPAVIDLPLLDYVEHPDQMTAVSPPPVPELRLLRSRYPTNDGDQMALWMLHRSRRHSLRAAARCARATWPLLSARQRIRAAAVICQPSALRRARSSPSPGAKS